MVTQNTSLVILEELKTSSNGNWEYVEDIKRICELFVSCNLMSSTVADIVGKLSYNDVDFGTLMVQLALSFGFEHNLVEMINEDSYTLTEKGWALGVNK